MPEDSSRECSDPTMEWGMEMETREVAQNLLERRSQQYAEGSKRLCKGCVEDAHDRVLQGGVEFRIALMDRQPLGEGP